MASKVIDIPDNGLDPEEEQDIVEEKKEEKSEKLQPYAYWEVGSKTYRLKLKADVICQLEKKIGKNLASVIMDDDIPPLSVMLTIIQGGMQIMTHGVTFAEVQKIFDVYCEKNGGSILSLFKDVLLPLYAVSGFFPKESAEAILRRADDLELTI